MKNKKCRPSFLRKYCKKVMAVSSMVVLTLLVGVYGTPMSDELGASVVNTTNYSAGVDQMVEFEFIYDTYSDGSGFTTVVNGGSCSVTVVEGDGENNPNCPNSMIYTGGLTAVTKTELMNFCLTLVYSGVVITNPPEASDNIRFTATTPESGTPTFSSESGFTTVTIQEGADPTSEVWTVATDGAAKKHLYTESVGSASGTCYDYLGAGDDFTADCITTLDAAFSAEYTFVDNETSFTVSRDDAEFTLTETVTDFNSPTFAFTVGDIPSSPVRAGDIFVINSTSDSGDYNSANMVYEYDRDGTSINGTTGTLTWDTTGLASATYTINGFYKNDTISATDSFSVEVKQGPTATFSHEANGLDIDFTDTSISDYAITDWDWDFNNDAVIDSTLQNPSHTFSESGNYPVKLTVTDTQGWTSNTTTIIPASTKEPPTLTCNTDYTNVWIGDPLTYTYTTTLGDYLENELEEVITYNSGSAVAMASPHTIDTTAFSAGSQGVGLENRVIANPLITGSYTDTINMVNFSVAYSCSADGLDISCTANITASEAYTIDEWTFDGVSGGSDTTAVFTASDTGNVAVVLKVTDIVGQKTTSGDIAVVDDGSINYFIYGEYFGDIFEDKKDVTVCVFKETNLEDLNLISFEVSVISLGSCPEGATNLKLAGEYVGMGVYRGGKVIAAINENKDVTGLYGLGDGGLWEKMNKTGDTWNMRRRVGVADAGEMHGAGGQLGTMEISCRGARSGNMIYEGTMNVEGFEAGGGVMSVGGGGDEGEVAFSVGGGGDEGEVAFSLSAIDKPTSMSINCDVYSTTNLELSLFVTGTLPAENASAILSIFHSNLSGTINSQFVEFINVSFKNVSGNVKSIPGHGSADAEPGKTIENSEQNQNTENNKLGFGNILGGRLFTQFTNLIKDIFGDKR